ncbi:MAG: hypothetical protein KG075_17925 [Alphaproteobacteria bacterium]|nr:hypothetical protein [Alphaproteobacteria bacterium]
MEKTTKKLALPGAYVFDEDFFGRLNTFASEYGKTITFTFELSDGSEIESLDFTSLKRIENTKSRRIKSVKISNGYSEPVNFRIDILSNIFGNSVDVRVTGPDSDCLHFCDRANQIFLTARQWYSWITRPPFGIHYILSLIGVIILVVDLMISMKSEAIRIGANYQWIFTVALIATWLPLLHVPLRRYFFPVAIFAVGDGKRLLKHIETLRNTLFVVIALAVGVNLASSFIYDTLKR